MNWGCVVDQPDFKERCLLHKERLVGLIVVVGWKFSFHLISLYDSFFVVLCDSFFVILSL